MILCDMEVDLMKKALYFVKNKLLGSHLEFRVQLFNVLAMTGVIASFLIGLTRLFTHRDIIITLIDWASSLIASGLLYYAVKTQKYVRCYYITIFVIFLCLFPYLYFIMGGYKGGILTFFIFAIVFTAFMLEKRAAYMTLLLELTVYIGCIVVSFIYPNIVRPFPDELGCFVHNLVDFIVSAVSLAIIALIHFNIYNRHQRDLETARAEAEAASEAKSRFLANMSHEIRTPINIMLGMNELMSQESDLQYIKQYSRNVDKAGKDLMTLINNVLDVASIERGKVEIKEDCYELNDMISVLRMIGEEYTKTRELNFYMNVDETLPRRLKGDVNHIRQIVSNFLSNSAKYTEHGDVTLSFSAYHRERTDEIILCIIVADTGVGISEENIPNLFDAFTRGNIQSGRYIEGSGLGLAISKDLADMMNGIIEVTSEVGKGSKFSVKIPQKVINSTAIGKWEEIQNNEIENINDLNFIAPECRLLLVDDNWENMKVIAALLSRTLIKIDMAVTGAECLTLTEKNRYDIILMDYMMPGMDGVETLRQLKEIPGFNTPVVILTANVISGVRDKLLEAGFCKYLSKPVMRSDLETTLFEFLPADSIEMITPEQIENNIISEYIDDVTKSALARDLSFYGIELNDGLRFVSDDIYQYKTSVHYVTENYQNDKSEINEITKRQDWRSMRFRVHALKSRALGLGANILSDTAAKLERLCKQGDKEYIMVTLPILIFEWERAYKGFKEFIEKLDDILPRQEKRLLSSANLDDLLQMIKTNLYSCAKNVLESLIENEESLEKRELLTEIWQKVDNAKFREAENMLKTIMKNEK